MATAVEQLTKKSYRSPDDSRIFNRQRLDIVDLEGTRVGHSRFEPGWKWSEDVGRVTGAELCSVRHSSYVISGRLNVRMQDGNELLLEPGDFAVIPPGHDAWVEGKEPVEIIDFGGDIASYAKK